MEYGISPNLGTSFGIKDVFKFGKQFWNSERFQIWETILELRKCFPNLEKQFWNMGFPQIWEPILELRTFSNLESNFGIKYVVSKFGKTILEYGISPDLGNIILELKMCFPHLEKQILELWDFPKFGKQFWN